MLPSSVYTYVWQISRTGQIRICLLIAVIAPLSIALLELQRRTVSNARVTCNLVAEALGAAKISPDWAGARPA